MPKKSAGSRSARPLILAVAAVAALALALPGSSLASFSGTNGKIFYEAPAVGGGSDVFSINPDGTDEVDLSSGNGFSEERPAASADGRHVVFQSFRDDGWNVFSMNADGSSQTDLTNTKDPVINFEPAWSPDGTKVAFMRQNLTPGEQDIWIMNADGSGQIDLTESLAQYSASPEFSPDGTRIVFIAAGPTPCCSTAYNNDIWVMNVNGSNPKQLTTTNEPTQNVGPAWSPDSAKIAYSVNSSPGGLDNGLHVMDADGGNQTRLLPGGFPVPSNDASWSPDGTRIVYEGAGGGFFSVINAADGSESTPLVSNASAHYPSWVPAASASGGGSGSTSEPGSGAGTGGGAPIPTPAPLPAPKPKPKALVCKKGFKKKLVKGKVKCVKRKHHKAGKKP